MEKIDLDKLISALIIVESNGKEDAIGDNGLAVGILQIHPIMVHEANRILRKEVYNYEDRKNKQKSIEIAKIYFQSRLKYNNTFSYEELARQWNGGPSGHLKDLTIQYWNKVKAILFKDK